MINIAIFASGNGTNAERIAEYFKDKKGIKVALVLTNNPDAYVFQRVKKYNIPTMVFNRKEFYHSGEVVQQLKNFEIDIIVLAGFLWLIPKSLLESFDKIVNIHPALLPKYGGKGMYGMKIHELVRKNNDPETGITIHWVNEKYDEGEAIIQVKCSVEPGDSPRDIADKIHRLEYKHYPEVIEKIAGIKNEN